MIEIKNVSHSLGENRILEEVSLRIPDNTVMGLVGINGAGKSTLLRLMSGVYVPDDGTVTYDGESPQQASTRENLFFLPDDPYFTAQTTCRSMLAMYKPFYPGIDEALFQRLIADFRLDDKKPLRNFSKGMRRQAYIAVALAIKPKYLLLDEAFDGLDPLTRKRVKEEVNRLVEEVGSTVIISSHSLRELEDFCDMYALIDDKTVRSSGDIAEKVSCYCKFQLAFLNPIPETLFDGLPVASLSNSGRFVRVILRGNREAMAARLKALNPAVMEEMPMNFEEAFISEVEEEGY